MKFLAIEKDNASSTGQADRDLLELEAREVYALYQQGIIREMYFNQNHEAVLLLECKDMKAAEESLSRLPLVSNGLISFEISELRPYTGFERLFKASRNFHCC
ncbi:MAG: hypothetical protein Q8S18_00415 [Bacteroidales bacterium]|nr:hypothetical protein [Bacteroidales bacterium]